MTQYYYCKGCNDIFDEFMPDFKKTEKDGIELCSKCREIALKEIDQARVIET